MKRDVDLCRRILLDVEKRDDGSGVYVDPISTHDGGYHIAILKDARYLAGIVYPTHECEVRLTNKGHDFLELARDDERWSEAKAKVLAQTGGLSFELIVSLLSMEAIKSLRYDA